MLKNKIKKNFFLTLIAKNSIKNFLRENFLKEQSEKEARAPLKIFQTNRLGNGNEMTHLFQAEFQVQQGFKFYLSRKKSRAIQVIFLASMTQETDNSMNDTLRKARDSSPLSDKSPRYEPVIYHFLSCLF